MLREFYIIDENALAYPIDEALIRKCTSLVAKVNHLMVMSDSVDAINLNESLESPIYSSIAKNLTFYRKYVAVLTGG